MIQKISDNLLLIKLTKPSGNIYLYKNNILIDTGAPQQKEEFHQALGGLDIKPEEIQIIINTHIHWDHTGNNDLFPRAQIYLHRTGVEIYQNHDDQIMRFALHGLPVIRFPRAPLPVDSASKSGISFEFYELGGHSGTDLLIYEREQGILWSGDLIYSGGAVPLSDLPGGSKKALREAVITASTLGAKVLCPGHGRISENPENEIKSLLAALSINNAR